LSANYLKHQLGLKLTAEEQALESQFRKHRNGN
jgi:hypothetical protein